MTNLKPLYELFLKGGKPCEAEYVFDDGSTDLKRKWNGRVINEAVAFEMAIEPNWRLITPVGSAPK